MQAHLPLGSVNKLANPECPIPYSLAFGDKDWMPLCDDNFGKTCIELTQPNSPSNHFYLCANAGHNLHMDNPKGLSEVMKMFFLGAKFESKDYE